MVGRDGGCLVVVVNDCAREAAVSGFGRADDLYAVSRGYRLWLAGRERVDESCCSSLAQSRIVFRTVTAHAYHACPSVIGQSGPCRHNKIVDKQGHESV